MSLYPRHVCSAVKVALLVSAATLLAIAPLTASADEKDRLCTLKGHKGAITAMSFSADGKLLSTGAKDNKVLLWSTETGKKLAELADTKLANPGSVALSPSGNLVAVSYATGGLHIWDASTPDKPPKKIVPYPIGDLAFSPDGKLLVSGFEVIDVDTMKRVPRQEVVASPEDTHASGNAAATRFYCQLRFQ